MLPNTVHLHVLHMKSASYIKLFHNLTLQCFTDVRYIHSTLKSIHKAQAAVSDRERQVLSEQPVLKKKKSCILWKYYSNIKFSPAETKAV